MENDVNIDFDAVSPLSKEVDVEPQEVQEALVVFVPFEDFPLTVNRTTKLLRKGVATKLSRDEARICLEANKGYTKD